MIEDRDLRVTAGSRAFIQLRAGDPRLQPITDADPADLSSVFYVAVLADCAARLGLRAALVPTLDGYAHFLNQDPPTPVFD